MVSVSPAVLAYSATAGGATDSGQLEERSRTSSSHLGLPRLRLGLGTLLSNLARGSSTASGSKGVGSFYPELSASIRWGNEWEIAPGVRFTFPFKSDQDGSVSKSIVALGADFGRQVAVYEFHLGSGLLLYWLRGAGGKVELNNGDGSGTYYRPDRSVLGRELYFGLGASREIPVGQSRGFRAGLDTFFTGGLSHRAAATLVLDMSYEIGHEDL